MYNIIGISKDSGKRAVMYTILSFDQAFDICHRCGWKWIDGAGKLWYMEIA